MTEVCAEANNRSPCRWWSTILSTLLLSFHPLTPFKLIRLEPHSKSDHLQWRENLYTASKTRKKRQILSTCLPRYLGWKNCLKWILLKYVCIYSIVSTQIGSNVEFLEPIKTSRHCFDFLLLLFLLAALSSCPLKCFIMFCSPELINCRLPCCSTWLWVPYSSSCLFVFF